MGCVSLHNGRDGGYAANETQLREEYSRQIQTKVKEAMGTSFPRELLWRDARGKTLKRHFNGLMYPVSARNDEVLIVRSFAGIPEHGAILGVELKKQLTWQVSAHLPVQWNQWSIHTCS